jgi:hypothetical protein
MASALCRSLRLSHAASSRSFVIPTTLLRRTLRPKYVLGSKPLAHLSRRHFATHTPSGPPSHKALLSRHPSQDDLDELEVYADLVPVEEAQLEMTDGAAEVRFILALTVVNIN